MEKEPKVSAKTSKSYNLFSPARRGHLILVVVALVASFALLGLGIVLFIGAGDNKTALIPGNPTPRPSVIADGLESPGPSTDFGLQPAPGPTPGITSSNNDAARLLLVADDYLYQGRPVEATAQYRLIIEKYPATPQAQAALYGLARSNVERDQFTEAAALFKQYLATYPNDPQRRSAYYYLGTINKALGYWDEAIANFQKYIAEPPDPGLLDGYALTEIAEAYTSLSKPQQAMETYKQVANSGATALMRVTALERVGDYFVKTNNPSEAVSWYSKVLELAKVPEYRATIIGKQARAYDAAGQGSKAIENTRLLIADYLDTTDGFATLKTLFNLNSNLLDDYYRGYYLLRAGNNAGAIEAFNRFLGRANDKAPQPPTPAGASKEVLNRLARAWFYLATLYEAKNDLSRAATEYGDLAARFPQAPTSAEAAWRLARLTDRQNKAEEAFKLYGQFAAQFPTDPNADQALDNQFRLRLAQSPEAAQPLADVLAQKYQGSNRRAQAFYELGRAFQVKNNAPAARAAFQKAITDPIADFYAVRAGERLTDSYDPNQPPRSNPTTHPAVYSAAAFAAELERDRKAMDSWLTGWAIVPPVAASTPTATPNGLEAVRQKVQNDPALKRIAELRTVDREEQGEREARELVERFNDSLLELYYISLSLSEQGQYYYSVAAARRVLALYVQKTPAATSVGLPRLLHKLIYPLPFQPLILEQSRRHDFDPLLMASLLRQESVFDPTAVSSAGARGMAQVMPDTGKAIAANLDKPGFKVDDLLRPYTAIEFGSYYLAARLKDFDGNPYQALAAYNGGAGNVYRWNKTASSDKNFDGWLENIDYPETRSYVQIIYTNYFMYRQIYAAGS